MRRTIHLAPRNNTGALGPQVDRGNHKRNTAPMLASPRCGARTRSGMPCRSPAVKGKKRCRMHGGAKGSGAPRGNKNALKHGGYTREALERRAQVRGFLKEGRKVLTELG